MLRRRHPAARVRIAGPVKGVRGPRGTWKSSVLLHRHPSRGEDVSFPALVEPAAELSTDEVRRYSRHLIIPDVGMIRWRL